MAFLSIISEVTAPTGLWCWLILNVFSFVANYGWRIVLFTVCLKVLLSPIDIYQRFKARKNQLITLKLKPDMDKLQKMYGNDQKLLAQKQMELQKKAGISYFSSCLPAIVTLVIFITLFSRGLQPISQYQNFRQYEQLYDTYVEYCNDSLVQKRYDEIYYNEIDKATETANGKSADIRKTESENLKISLGDAAYNAVIDAKVEEIYYSEYHKQYDEYAKKRDFYAEEAKKQLAEEAGRRAYAESMQESLSAFASYDDYVKISQTEKRAILEEAERAKTLAINQFDAEYYKTEIENLTEEKIVNAANAAVRKIAENASGVLKAANEAKAAALTSYDEDYYSAELNQRTADAIVSAADSIVRATANNYCKDIAQDKVFHAYENGVKMSFLWVKNIWNADTFWTKPINGYDGFIKNVGNYAKPGHGVEQSKLNDMLNSAKYTDVMGKLLDDPEYNSSNGYLVLPILTVLLSIAMQVLSYRQQKESGQMNAQSESTSKIMMFVMPVMMAWFAFSYTAAFAVYLVMSYVVSILISVIGMLVVKLADKKTDKALVTEVQKYGRPDFSDRRNDANDNNKDGKK